MKYLFVAVLSALNLFFIGIGYSQTPEKQTSVRPWNADWIACRNNDGMSYGVFYFRKNIDLTEKPASFKVHVSADNRFKLYVNGTLVSLGPARGDTYYWNYETVDLAPFLVSGKNNILALVWNESHYRPEAQMSIRTGFILQGDSPSEDVVNTNETWKCVRDNGYSALPGIFAAGIGEMVDMNQSIMGWNKPGFDDSAWPLAGKIETGYLKINVSLSGLWMLVPSPLPAMELTYQRIPVLRKALGMKVPDSFPARQTPFTIPAKTKVSLLLDQTVLTNAYVTLNFSGGKDARIGLKYAESLVDEFTPYGAKKGNRNDVEGKTFYGRRDSLISCGKKDQSYTTLYWRTFRYMQLNVQTGDEPLTLDDIYGTFTGYPFKQEAVFTSSNNEIQQMIGIGWRTARLCAMETYWDCPFYEQLQYIGDTRIQAMISYYNSSDDRLAQNALTLMDHSRLPEGVTFSRYPTKGTQIISTFSLWYIGMLHDYWMYRPNPEFVKDKLTGERAILEFFGKYQAVDGSLKDLPYWNFVDWADGDGWFIGAPPRGADGSSAVVDIQLLMAYQWAAGMEKAIGMPVYAQLFEQKAASLEETIVKKYWDSSKKLFSDTKEKTRFSQHANSLAILAGLVDESNLQSVCQRLLNDQSLTKCTLYFRYYLNQALVKGGYGDNYLQSLGDWRNSMDMGFTTWPETSNLAFSRSDCHAWSSSPNIEFYRTVLGIDSDAPGFSAVRIEPHLGSLTKVSGEIPHADGKIAVSYIQEKTAWKIEIQLPQNTPGIFVWKEKTYKLKPGINSLSL